MGASLLALAKSIYYATKYYVLWFNFILGLNFNFPLFLGMIVYDNECKKKEIKFKRRIKLNHNTYNSALFWVLSVLRLCLAKSLLMYFDFDKLYRFQCV